MSYALQKVDFRKTSMRVLWSFYVWVDFLEVGHLPFCLSPLKPRREKKVVFFWQETLCQNAGEGGRGIVETELNE
jgi:hypothetical protein